MKTELFSSGQLFTDQEYKALILLACGTNGATKQQIHWFIKQCERLKIDALLLEAIQSGKVVVSDISEDDFALSRRSQ